MENTNRPVLIALFIVFETIPGRSKSRRWKMDSETQKGTSLEMLGELGRLLIISTFLHICVQQLPIMYVFVSCFC